MSKMEMSIVIGVIACACVGIAYAARALKMDGDRSQTILNIRNCQQGMRGDQGIRQLSVGDPYTREHVEKYLKFPEDIHAIGGDIQFTPGSAVTPIGVLWLQVKAPGTVDCIGRYGFEDPSDFAHW